MTSAGDSGAPWAEIGRTGRGVLRRSGDRLVRVIDPRLCDERFRTALAELHGQPPPDTLPIVDSGPAHDGYHLEYAAPAELRTLGEAYAEAGHWSGRLVLAARVCEALDGWHHGRLATLGLDLHSVLVGSAVWLAPCPPVRAGTPRDLFGLDVPSLAGLAPELVRGTVPHQRAEDAYALGTLAALALGCRAYRPDDDPGDLVERQARDALLEVEVAASEVEPALRPADRLDALVRTIRLYRSRAADARPTDAAELRRALIAAADLLGLAEELWAAGDPVAGLEALENAAPGLSMHWLAGRINAGLGRATAAFDHYAEAVRLSPTQFRLREQRLDDLWRLWPPDGDAPAEWAEALLDDIARLRRWDKRNTLALWLREADVHERRGDRYALATALHEAANRNPGSFEVLYRYGTVLRGLEATDEVTAVKELACSRLRTVGRMPGMAEEAARWCRRFDEL
jgi:hypothetical protein